jgi:hypothetical protein
MTRCNTCNGVITRNDAECYICGERVPGAKVSRSAKRKSNKTARSVTPVSNVLFIATLLVVVACFLLQPKMPMPISGALAGILFTARIVTDRRAAKRIQIQQDFQRQGSF